MGPTASEVYDLAIDPQDPSTVFVTTTDGVRRTRDGGKTWRRVLGIGALPGEGGFFVAVDPSRSRTVYAARGTRLARSVDGGDTWSSLPMSELEFIPDGFNSLTVAPQGGTLYATNRAGRGLLVKSEDQGGSWTRISQGIDAYTLWTAVVDPSHPSVLYAATSNGVWKSVDGGESWSRAGFSGLAVFTLAVEPRDTSVLYAGTEKGVYKSRDAAASWLRSGPFGNRLAIAPDDPDTVYVGSRYAGIYRSRDGGDTWKAMVRRVDQRRVEDLEVDPRIPGTVYAATRDGGLLKSVDAGRVWKAIDVGAGVRLETELVIDASAAGTFYASTLTGVYRSDDEGRTWHPFSQGLDVEWVSAVTVAPDGSGTVYAGTSDGLWAREAGGVWRRKGLVENVNRLAIDPYPPGCFYAWANDSLYESCDGGVSWQFLADGGLTAFAVSWDVEHPSFYVVRFSTFSHHFLGVYRSLDRGRTWESRTEGLTSEVLVLAPSPRSGVLYAGTRQGIYKTTNAGLSWFPANQGLDGSPELPAVYEIVVDPREPAHVYARYGEQLVESFDAGGFWRIAAEWPGESGRAQSLALHPWSPSTIYAAGQRLVRPRCGKSALCFDRQRFTVEVVWRDGDRTGLGKVTPAVSADSGVLWFFDEDNWEMLVKVLDGCAVNGRYWVFAAATTNVEYGLRVTDRRSGRVKSYFNPAGKSADALTDAAAFATCPPRS